MDHSEVKHLPKVDHTPAELSPERKLMLAAANLLEKSGLCKFVFCDSSGRMCLRGALAAAAGLKPEEFRHYKGAHTEADKLMARALGSDNEDGAAEWNNATERTKDEVVAKLRAVALGL